MAGSEEPTPMRVLSNRLVSRSRTYRVLVLQPLRSFSYKPGQSAELEIAGETRVFSIASSPGEGVVMFATIVRDSGFKRSSMAGLAEGEVVSVWGPYGHFILDEEAPEILAIACGGIGITPIRSIALHAASLKLPARMTIFHVDEREDYLFREDLERASREDPRISVAWVREMPGPEDIRRSAGDVGSLVAYVSGPPGDVREAVEALRRAGLRISRERLKVESFTGY